MATEIEDPIGVKVWRRDPPVYSDSSFLEPSTGWYLGIKSLAEFLFAFGLLVLTIPLVILAAILVKLTSRGPVFYSQVRLGKNGKPFTIFKVRTMYHRCESLTGPQWSQPGDSRITPVGRFLRQTHLDELPQLWNVLRGDMSLVGPRPERPEFVDQLEKALPLYRSRLQVRPGITGLAQVQLPPDTDLASVRRKLAHDIYYVRRLGCWLDLRILISTGMNTLGIPNSWFHRLTQIPGGEKVETAYENAAAVLPILPVLEVQPV
jgi:lipopolysaccharide/colanic/teichoic acid biosynthesis glycosyltransferase